MNTPVYNRWGISVYHGDCLDVMRDLPDAAIDAVITDPPYGLEFMGAEWDSFKPGGKRPSFGKPDGSKFRQNMGTPSWGANGNPTCRNCGGDKYRNGPRKCACGIPDFGNHMAAHMVTYQKWCTQWASECLRVLKPGGWVLAFGGTRTYHRLTCGIEDAGFEIRDSIGSPIAWVYGAGFPKSQRADAAIMRHQRLDLLEDPLSPEAEQWVGHGTALKPSWEPIVVARKPMIGTLAVNLLAHGTGALNIDATRVTAGQDYRNKCASVVGLGSNRNGAAYGEWTGARTDSAHPAGRWPPNAVFTHHPACGETVCAQGCPIAELDQQSGVCVTGWTNKDKAPSVGAVYGDDKRNRTGPHYADSGGASRCFPCFRWEAKAPTAERPKVNGNAHPTVKPIDLMRWLVRLVTPPGGTVLDCFAGTGTTGQAARAEGHPAILIENDPESITLIAARLDARPKTNAPTEAASDQPQDLFDLLGDAS